MSTTASLKVIAFDADDTLWHNEIYFQESEEKFAKLLEDYLPQHTVTRELLKTEIDNLPLYGYGIKAFMLSMIETTLRVSDGTSTTADIETILKIGKEMLQKPVVKLEGVDEVLEALSGKYRLVLATKGDLLDQERKLSKSGLEGHFHHIEIMSEKKDDDYKKLLKHLDIEPHEFAMVGNSLKSDIIPVLNIGGHGFHVPYHVNWELDTVKHKVEHENLQQVDKISEVLQYL